MSGDRQLILTQAIVDVRFKDGLTYFDKCGSVGLALAETLGKPFVASVPQMTNGDVRSAAERLVVTYSQENLNVTQGWVRSPARVEQLAPTAWDVVGSALNVTAKVVRVGVRFSFVWPKKTKEEAEAAVAKLTPSLGRVSDVWAPVLGTSYSELSRQIWVNDSRGPMKLAVEVLGMKFEPSMLPADLVDLIPAFGVTLDLDHVHPAPALGSDDVATLSKGGLKDFIRSAWQRSKTASTTVEEQLGIGHGD